MPSKYIRQRRKIKRKDCSQDERFFDTGGAGAEIVIGDTANDAPQSGEGRYKRHEIMLASRNNPEAPHENWMMPAIAGCNDRLNCPPHWKLAA